MHGGFGFRMKLILANPVPSHQAIEIVAVGSVCPEGFLVKQALNAAAQTYLIGMALHTNRPTHLAMPATPEKEHSRPGKPGRYHP